MRDCDVIVLALSSLLGEISSEGRLPITDEFGSVEKSISQIARTTLLHVGVGTGSLEFAGFIS